MTTVERRLDGTMVIRNPEKERLAALMGGLPRATRDALIREFHKAQRGSQTETQRSISPPLSLV